MLLPELLALLMSVLTSLHVGQGHSWGLRFCEQLTEPYCEHKGQTEVTSLQPALTHAQLLEKQARNIV